MPGKDRSGRSITRRTLLKGAGAAALAASALPHGYGMGRAATLVQTPPTRDIGGTRLTMLQWSHFVPGYDQWFDQFVAEWGEANGVETQVDHINTADVPAALASEVGAGQGHDLIQHITPLGQFEPQLLDLSDVVQEAVRRHGEQLAMARGNTFNPTTNVFYGFCHGYAPLPGYYRRSLWEQVDLPNGPTTWQELLDGGSRIRQEQGVQLGLGMSNEIDSQIAAQILLWSYGAAIQDESENVTLDSPATVEAVDYMARLFNGAMTPEVFGWTAASNNQLLLSGQASYIINATSAYRIAQEDQPEVAEDIYFAAPLLGPGGPDRALGTGNPVYIYMLPRHAENADTAKEFLLHLVGNYAAISQQSTLYDFPAFPSTVPDLNESLANDPFGSDPVDKLAVLQGANDRARNLGWPGPANTGIGEVFVTNVLSNMMARVAQGQMDAQQSVTEAALQVEEIFARWRGQGLMGGGR